MDRRLLPRYLPAFPAEILGKSVFLSAHECWQSRQLDLQKNESFTDSLVPRLNLSTVVLLSFTVYQSFGLPGGFVLSADYSSEISQSLLSLDYVL